MKNNQFHKLAALQTKRDKYILGCISGTSMDGLDLALCNINGFGTTLKADILEAQTIPYPDELYKPLRSLAFQPHINARELCRLHTLLGRWTGNVITKACKGWNIPLSDIDAIGSHGQTIFHAPDSGDKPVHGTLQISDGDHISRITGVPVVSDFRQKHIAGGGEGAPLATYGDWLLCRSDSVHRILLNIGGISNFTFLPAKGSFSDCITGDIGPGNTLMDDFMKEHFGKPFDENGAIARKGTVHNALLKHLLGHNYFSKPFPKTTGQETFSKEWMRKCIAECAAETSPEDILATLLQLTAKSIANALEQFTSIDKTEVYVSGGGANNPYLMEHLSMDLNLSIQKTDAIGCPADFKEALIFAVLTNETLCGSGFPSPDGIGIITFGKISIPQ